MKIFRLLILFFLLTSSLFFIESAQAESAKPSQENFGLSKVSENNQESVFYDTRGHADLVVPHDYRLVPPVSNDQVFYDFGLKNKKDLYEVRLRFDPVVPSMKEYEECERKKKEKPGSCAMVPPDKPTEVWAQAILLNLSGGKMGTFQFFPPQAVKQEFGADWGVTSSLFQLKDPAFAGPYTQGQIIQVYKNGVGAYTLIFLFKDTKIHQSLMEKIFHLVKFKS